MLRHPARTTHLEVATTWRHYAKAAIGVGLIALLLSTTGAGPAVAQGVLKPVQAFIVNTSADPVPVSLVGSQPVTPPLWQGTPFAKFDVVLNPNPEGVQECQVAFEAAANTAVLLKTVSGSFNVPSGNSGAAAIRITNLDGSTTPVEVPMHRTAGASVGSTLYEQYSGSLELGGFPVTKVEACLVGIEAGMGISFLGFTVVLP